MKESPYWGVKCMAYLKHFDAFFHSPSSAKILPPSHHSSPDFGTSSIFCLHSFSICRGYLVARKQWIHSAIRRPVRGHFLEARLRS